MQTDRANGTVIRWLTYLMFLMFAMTSDAVGTVITEIIKEFSLSLKAASAFHYVPMAAIAVGAVSFGFMADRLGRKPTIIIGLLLYGISCLLFAFGDSFGQFVALLACAGIGVSIFKVGALALIGDISTSGNEHTALMNRVEGFFGVGAIIGPAVVATLLAAGISWKYLYVLAAAMCGLLMLVALWTTFPKTHHSSSEPVNLRRTLRMMRNPYALGFSALIMLYVAVEVAIYVWMPTYLEAYRGSNTWLATYALTIFFVLRAAGRFMGAWLLQRYRWTLILAVFGGAILACFVGSLWLGVTAGVFLLPLSGLFMSMMYPTLNSKGISCFTKDEHGAVAGVILFFTACAAAAGPLAMAAVSDAMGGITAGFALATAFAALLFAGLLINHLRDPAASRLALLDRSEYAR